MLGNRVLLGGNCLLPGEEKGGLAALGRMLARWKDGVTTYGGAWQRGTFEVLGCASWGMVVKQPSIPLTAPLSHSLLRPRNP